MKTELCMNLVQIERNNWKNTTEPEKSHDQHCREIFLMLTNGIFLLSVALELEKLWFAKRFCAIGHPITCSVMHRNLKWIWNSLSSLSLGSLTTQTKNSVFANSWTHRSILNYLYPMKFGTTLLTTQTKYSLYLMDLTNILERLKSMSMTFRSVTM